MRVKAALVIMSIVFVITAAYLVLSLSFTRQNMGKTIEQELSLAIEIANDLVATKIKLLESNAAMVAERLHKAGSVDEMAELMKSQLDEFDDFKSLTLYDQKKLMASYGEPVSGDIFLTEAQYLRVIHYGETIFSTMQYNNVSKNIVMHLYVPIGGDLVLSAAISGMLFTDLLLNYRFWQTGNIFMLDETGNFIAHYRHEFVLDHNNFILESKTNPELQSIGNFFQKIITSKQGTGTYQFEGVERLCIYQYITGSKTGWYIAVSVPLSESPLLTLRNDLLLSALCFLALGVLISIFISGIVAQHFNKIKEQNRNLAELNEIVLAASEAKTGFLARMSHEMRTPLTAIIGLSDLSLETGQLNEENTENLEKIYNAGKTLLSTVNDILDISKIEAGKLEIVPSEYETSSMLNDTITQNIMRIGEKPIKFILSINENLPTRLCGDDLRVKQILNNLLSNAFKYTLGGTVELGVNCEREADTIWMTAKVSDTGKGIRPEDMEKLFINYTQVDTKVNHHIEGTGLGLSITKKLTEMMGGTITVESEYGKGSTFTAKFQQQFVTDAVIGADAVNSLKNFRYSDHKRRNSLHPERINLSYARVLVVDDVSINLDVARGMMKPYRMHINCVTSGQEAINAIRAEKVRYNAIFMDHMMPEMDGIETVKRIREEIGTEYAKTIPIIALTANAIIGNEKMFLSNGFQDFLSKPIEPINLDEVIQKWVRDKEYEKTLAVNRQINVDGQTFLDKRSGKERRGGDRRSGFDRRVFGRGVSGLDIGKGLKRFNGDNDSYVEILRSFTKNILSLLDTVTKVDKENLANYAITVHGMKSSARGIGADSMGNKAEALEKAAKENDYDFVIANNAPFIEEAKKLASNLNDMLNKMTPKITKPKKDRPDSEALNKLLIACKALDIDKADAVMAELEAWDYESDDGLVAWLRENVSQLNFVPITEKLSAI
jgi:signal transduction histidine kinase/CheY-like chemotaxis protein/HPt (histidine-containing phosphotransfer) domain-containing protein